jgi:hypothetical protein
LLITELCRQLIHWALESPSVVDIIFFRIFIKGSMQKSVPVGPTARGFRFEGSDSVKCEESSKSESEGIKTPWN